MELSDLTRQRIAELRVHHQPAGIALTRTGRFSWWRNLFPDRRCQMCYQRMPCSQIRWCNRVEAHPELAPAAHRIVP